MKRVFVLLFLLLLQLAAHAAPPQTLFELAGAHPAPARLADSVVVVIDAQREYVDGALPLVGIDPALAALHRLLERARAAGTPVVHVVHHGGPGLFDPAGRYFAIAPQAAPQPGETVVEKRLPNAFAGTELHAVLEKLGRKQLIVVGFMTHMCVGSTVRAALDLGYATTVVAAATATRDLPDPAGGTLPAAEIQRATLAALADRFAVVVKGVEEIPD